MSDEDVKSAGTEGVADDVGMPWALLVVVRNVHHKMRELVSLTFARSSDTAPEILSWKGAHVETSHDAQNFQSHP